MEILITAAVIALAIFTGLAKVAQAMREPRPIDPAALVALEEKIAEAAARADRLGALTLQFQQKAIETRESLEEMTETLDRYDVEQIVSDWMDCDFCLEDHFDKDALELVDCNDLHNQMDSKLEEIELVGALLTELKDNPDLREDLAKALTPVKGPFNCS